MSADQKKRTIVKTLTWRVTASLTTFIIALSYAVCYIALNIIIEGDFSEIDWSSIGYLGISALLTLLAYPLIYAFEKVFSFIDFIYDVLSKY